MKIKLISIVILGSILVGCTLPIASQYISIREDSLSISPAAGKVALGLVASDVKGITAEDLHAALTASLAGQNMLASSNGASTQELSVRLLSASNPSWGIKTTVKVQMKYALYPSGTSAPSMEDNFQEACTLSLGQAGALEARATLIDDDSKSVFVPPGSDLDKSLGYPAEGAIINSKDAFLRGSAARDCALRKGFVHIFEAIS